MKSRELMLELQLGILLAGDLIEGHADKLLSLGLEVEEVVRPLELEEVVLDIEVVIHIHDQLLPPLTHLLVIKESLAKEVIELDPYFGVELILEVEPQFLNFYGWVIHVFTEVLHFDHGLYSELGVRLVNHLDFYPVIIAVDFELESSVVNWILVGLPFGLAELLRVYTAVFNSF